MVLNRITASEYATKIGTGITDRDPTLDTIIGPIRDLQVQPVADVLEMQNNRIVYLSNLQSLKYASKMVDADLDDIVYNESIVRWEGSRAVTTCVFYRYLPPAADVIVPVNFPISTAMDPNTGLSITFRTIETQTMFAAAPTAYYNATTGRYELSVAVSSIVTGTEAGVGANTITVLRRALTGMDGVTNPQATTSGRDSETNEEVATRYLLKIEGSQLGTPSGLKIFVLDNFSEVEDAYVVYGTSAYLTREAEDAGALDCWILGSAPLTATYTTRYPGIDTLISVPNQPLMSIVSVTDGVSTFVEDDDFEAVTGEGEYAYSNLGTDGIRFVTGGALPLPSPGDPLTVQYQYNAEINILASFFRQPEYYVVGQDRLFRWAQQLDLAIEGQLKVSAGNPTSVLTSVKAAIKDYVNAMKLGENVEEFDLDAEISKVYGVDNFTWIQLAESGGTGVGDITVPPNEYPRIADSDLVISLV